ncbi:single-stranded DNA-binding protein [Alkalicoccus chagannorensis]|uniref:single-stranded DNA-binding protein n=1 Tax=Alkalicoccus chagannorensis TaxID=427072 RepID=UPI0004123B19|nr:single-stranded DNA-binding protein [Alkalicoccus chagannorensis]
MFNQFIFVGRIAKNPHLVTTNSGTPLTRFTLAVQRPYRTKKGTVNTDFVQICCWNQLAERVAEYCGTGSMITVKGRVQTRELHMDNEKKMTVPDLTADSVTFLKINKVTEQEERISLDEDRQLVEDEVHE